MQLPRLAVWLGLAGVWWSAPAFATPVLWRLDCGTIQLSNMDEYSDTFQYVGRQKELAVSCYLIKNGDRYLLWDTGLPAEYAGRAITRDGMRLSLRQTLRSQLAELGVDPNQISFVGLSHYHFDHVGQAADFPNATLLMGARDWDAVNARADRAQPLLRWTQGGGSVTQSAGDHDVFGDDQVVMLATPGHTPGHRSLLVRLRRRGNVLLSGDLYHFYENVRHGGVPSFNSDRSDTLASIDRFRRIATNLRATVIIQHEPGDINKLPVFPRGAD